MASSIPERRRTVAAVLTRLLRPAHIALLLVLVTGCSSTTFFYNRLDFLIPWYLGRYVDLDGTQEAWFDERLVDLLAWHRREELPRYVEFLAQLEKDLDTTLTVELLATRSDQLEKAWYRLRDPALEALLVLGARLDDEQITDFIAALRKRQMKYERKYLERSEKEFREDAADNLSDMLEDYLGRLDRGQRETVDATARALLRSDATWLRERQDWITQMEQLLQRAPGWQKELRQTIVEWESALDADALALYDHNERLVMELVADTVNRRSERQDRRLRRRLSDLGEDFSSLTGEAVDQQR